MLAKRLRGGVFQIRHKTKKREWILNFRNEWRFFNAFGDFTLFNLMLAWSVILPSIRFTVLNYTLEICYINGGR